MQIFPGASSWLDDGVLNAMYRVPGIFEKVTIEKSRLKYLGADSSIFPITLQCNDEICKALNTDNQIKKSRPCIHACLAQMTPNYQTRK